MRIFFVLLISLFSLISQAQEVGIVFSGGAAKGLAHIGVLKALEEHDIPIDYITGTSMGAIVGAFYAAGYSPQEIEQLVLSSDFEHWINGTSSEKYVYNYTKSQDDPSWATLDVLINNQSGLSLNTPLANDLVINFVLNEYLGQASEKAKGNFDRLFVPFKAIAAEVFSQEAVTLDSGSLVQAVRASMAVPFFYNPIKFQDRFLFDGGVYNNFPVDVMEQSYAPDVIIGVNVAEKKVDYPFGSDEEKLQEALVFLFLDKTDPNKLNEDDIYLEPDLQGRTALDFDEATFLVQAGYQEAINQMGLIKARISRRSNQQTLEQKRSQFRSGFQRFEFGALELSGFEERQARFLRKLISFEDGTKTLKQVSEAYFQLVSEPFFNNIYPGFRYDEAEQHYVLELFLKREVKGAFSVDLGGNLTTRRVGALSLGLRYNRFGRYLNTYKIQATTGRFYESLNLATRFNTNPRTRLFVEPSFTYNQWNYLDAKDFLDNSFDPNILERIDRRVGVTVGLGTGQRSVVTAGVHAVRNTDDFSNTPVIATTDTLDQLDFFAFRANLAYERNSLNLKQFPTEGTRFFSSIDFFSGRTEYIPGSTSPLFIPGNDQLFSTGRDWFRIKVKFEEYGALSKRFTLGWAFEGVYSSQPLFDNFQSSLLYANAYEPMFDSKTFFLPRYRAFSYIAAGVKNIYKFNRSLQLRLELYGFGPFSRPEEQPIQNFGINNQLDKLYFTGMAALVYNSLLGPVSLRFNYYEDDISRFGLMLSFGYLIFNQKSDE